MYFSAQNGVYALDAATGKQIWKYETTGTARRGPYYWPGGSGVGPRIFSQTANGLAAIDPKDGTIITSFGTKGFIAGLRMTSPPVAYKNILVTQGGNSTVKAWDTVTGEARWTLNLKAQPGDPAACDLARRQPEDDGGSGPLGILLGRRRTRTDLRAGGESRQRLLRRSASRQQLVQRLPARRGCEHRQDQVVPAARASRHLGLRPGRAAGARRRPTRRPHDSRRLAHHEDGHHVRVQPRNRRADVRDGRASRAADDGERGVDVADAAVPAQARCRSRGCH